MRRRLSPRHAAQSALAARGAGLLKPSSIRSLRSSRDRHPNPTASPTGPSHGLPQSVARIPPIWRGRRRSPALPDRPQPGGIAAALQATRAGARRKRRAWAATKKAACRRALGGTGRPLPDLPAAGIAAFPFGLDDALARTARPGLEAAARGLACGVSGRRALQALPPARARHGRCRRQAALRRPALIGRGAPHRSALGRSARCARCPHGLWSRQPQEEVFAEVVRREGVESFEGTMALLRALRAEGCGPGPSRPADGDARPSCRGQGRPRTEVTEARIEDAAPDGRGLHRPALGAGLASLRRQARRARQAQASVSRS